MKRSTPCYAVNRYPATAEQRTYVPVLSEESLSQATAEEARHWPICPSIAQKEGRSHIRSGCGCFATSRLPRRPGLGLGD
jgi:hypothetical protein